MSRITFLSLLLVGLLGWLVIRWLATATSEPTVAGRIVIKGSDTEVQMSAQLADAFSQQAPQTVIAVTGGGSGTGLAALISGEIDVANSSRPMSPAERDQLVRRGGTAQEFIYARDLLALIVNPHNNITSLSLNQLGALYRGAITNWSALGGPDQAVVLYGRQSSSGTFIFFRDRVVAGEYAPSMRGMEGNQAIYDAVSQDPGGIGYLGFGYLRQAKGTTTQVKVLAIQSDQQILSPFDEADRSIYPLSRPLYQYLRRVPAANTALTAFLRFELSPAGQAIVADSGFFPPTNLDQQINESLWQQIH